MSRTVITQPCYGAKNEITCHLLTYAAPDATRRTWKEKSKTSSNVTRAKRYVPTLKKFWERHSHAFPPTTPLDVTYRRVTIT